MGGVGVSRALHPQGMVRDRALEMQRRGGRGGGAGKSGKLGYFYEENNETVPVKLQSCPAAK